MLFVSGTVDLDVDVASLVDMLEKRKAFGERELVLLKFFYFV